jgi:hypothetical protein
MTKKEMAELIAKALSSVEAIETDSQSKSTTLEILKGINESIDSLEVSTGASEDIQALLEAKEKEIINIKGAQSATQKKMDEIKRLYDEQMAKLEGRDFSGIDKTIKEHERMKLVLKIAREKDIPIALLDRIQGETEEELTADAQSLLSIFSQPAKTIDIPTLPREDNVSFNLEKIEPKV